jgi:hypothetical protein
MHIKNKYIKNKYIKNKYIKNKFKIIFALIITISLLFISIFISIYLFSNNKIKSQNLIKNNIQNKINFYNQEIDIYKNKKLNKKPNKKPDSQNISKIKKISTKNELPELLKIISLFKTGLNIFTIKSISQIKNNKINKINSNIKSQDLLIEINTDYKTAINLLNKLKDYPYLITFNKIIITNNNPNKLHDLLNLTLELVIYKN